MPDEKYLLFDGLPIVGGVKEIAEFLGLTSQGLYELRKHLPDFPQPVATVGGRPAWFMIAVKDWAEACRRSPTGRYVRPAKDLKSEQKIAALTQENERLKETVRSFSHDLQAETAEFDQTGTFGDVHV